MRYILPLILFFSCNKNVDCNNLIFKDRVTYYKGRLYTGKCDSYFENGMVKSTQQYKDGKDDSSWTFYYPSGKIETNGQFENGKRIGEWKYYFENGSLKQLSNYSFGKKNGLWIKFTEKGDTINKIEFKLDSIMNQKNY